jgi:drug/metabolite transporter (DMT)-like permease
MPAHGEGAWGGRLPGLTRPMSPTAAATAGAICISSSAVLMKLAHTTPSITALGRCALALPVLGVLAWAERRRGAPPLSSRTRWLARLAGLFLAGDLIVWSHAITAIGAGLSTVVGNLQVIIVAMLAWAFLGERPHRALVFAFPIMLGGLVLVGGLADVGGSRAYGADPALGVVYGVAVAVIYAIFILTLRQATASQGPRTPGSRHAVAGVLFEATVGATVASALLGLVLNDYRVSPGSFPWPALGWLALLALTSQVIGWLLITVSMPRLPAGMIGALLLIQPAGSVALSYVFLDERPSALQLVGVLLVLVGVVVAVSGSGSRDVSPRRSTRIIRQASDASTGVSAAKSP